MHVEARATTRLGEGPDFYEFRHAIADDFDIRRPVPILLPWPEETHPLHSLLPCIADRCTQFAYVGAHRPQAESRTPGAVVQVVQMPQRCGVIHLDPEPGKSRNAASQALVNWRAVGEFTRNRAWPRSPAAARRSYLACGTGVARGY